MRVSTSASQACGSTPLSFAVTISVAMAAAPSAPPRAGKQPRLASKREASQRTLGGVVRQADPAVLQEVGEAGPASQQVVDRLGPSRGSRQARDPPQQPPRPVAEK